MAQRIMVAFDTSENAMRAVAFIARAFPKEDEITLFHVLSDPAVLCEMHSPDFADHFTSQRNGFFVLEEKKKELVQDAMERARALLAASGFPETGIRLKLEARKKGIAKDILDEAETGYDLIVIGRRGLSPLAEFFIGSVSHKILSASRQVAVLVVN